MKDFLAEFWPWIVIPFVLVIGSLALLSLWVGGGDSASPFQYHVFN